MQLLENEKVLIESDTNEFILTTHRIRQEIKVRGGKQFKSIMLEELDSISLKFKSNPISLVIAAIAVVLGVAVSSLADGGPLGFVIAIIMVVIYFASRQIFVSFHANKESIIMSTKGVGYEKSKELIDQVEKAKNDRILALA